MQKAFPYHDLVMMSQIVDKFRTVPTDGIVQIYDN